MPGRFALCCAAGMAFATSLVAARSAEALDPERAVTQYVLESWTPREGAPAGSITGIAQTPSGYLWLGTESDGLIRFDGVAFARADDLDPLFGRRVDRITSLLCDSHGALWVGTNFGLARLSKGQWTVFERGEFKQVFGLHEAPDGAIWFARHWEGLYQISGDRVTHLPLAGKPRMVAIDASGALWAGGFEGLWRLAGQERRRYSAQDGLADPNVTYVYSDRSRSIWVGSPRGLMLVRGNEIGRRFTTRDGLSGDDVSVIYADREGSLWVGTATGGLDRRRGERFEALTQVLGLNSNHVTAVYEDREGSLWVGTSGGLNRLRDASFLPIGKSEGLRSGNPLAIVADQQGQVFVSSGFGGLNQIRLGHPPMVTTDSVRGAGFDGPLFADPEGGIWSGRLNALTYRHLGRRALYSVDGLVTCIGRDTRSLVFGTSTGRVFRLVNGRPERYLLADGSLLGPETLGFDYVWMLHLARDGTLWLATSRGVIAVRSGHAWRVWSQRMLSARSIFEDEQGTIWLGTMAGVVRISGQSVATFTVKDGLPQDDIFHVLCDRQGGVWASCARGIFRIKRRDLEDVGRGAPRTLAVEMFGATDGMRMPEATSDYQPSGCVTPDGRLWFRTGEGVAMIDPTRMRRNTLPPPVVVETMVADGEPLPLGMAAQVPAATQRLAIHYNGLSLLVPQRVRFKYMLEGYDRTWVDGEGRRVAQYTKLPPGAYTFRVMAANNDGVWSDTAASLQIRKLPHFYQTVWFLTLAALAVVGTLFGGHRWRVAALVTRERDLAQRVEQRTAELKRETAQHKLTAEWLATERDLRQASIRREVLAKERTRMARELHDSLAQHFAALCMQLESVALDLPADATASRASLGVAARMLDHAQTEARRAVWDLRAPDGESTSLKQALERAVAGLRYGESPRIELRVDPEDVVVARATQRDLLRIVEEAVTNAVAHAQASLVVVHVSVQASELLLEVRDDGQGFVDVGCTPDVECAAAEAGHFGLLGMRERAVNLGGSLEIVSQPGAGTCVRLRCPWSQPEPA